jgi:hypothetical protein
VALERLAVAKVVERKFMETKFLERKPPPSVGTVANKGIGVAIHSALDQVPACFAPKEKALQLNQLQSM